MLGDCDVKMHLERVDYDIQVEQEEIAEMQREKRQNLNGCMQVELESGYMQDENNCPGAGYMVELEKVVLTED